MLELNLASTISILAGGPGSGCQGANCGRPSTVGSSFTSGDAGKGKSSLDRTWKNSKGYEKIRLPRKQIRKDLNEGYDWEATLPISQIRQLASRKKDGGDGTSFELAAKYAEAMRQRKRFPVIDVTLARDGKSVIVNEGNHRFMAWKSSGHTQMPVNIDSWM